MSKWYVKIIIDSLYITDIDATSLKNAENKAHDFATVLDLLDNIKSFNIYVKAIEYHDSNVYSEYEKTIINESFKYTKYYGD